MDISRITYFCSAYLLLFLVAMQVFVYIKSIEGFIIAVALVFTMDNLLIKPRCSSGLSSKYTVPWGSFFPAFVLSLLLTNYATNSLLVFAVVFSTGLLVISYLVEGDLEC